MGIEDKMSGNLNVLIPSAGLGKRFNSNIPKPLLDVHGKPMLVRVLENFNQIKNINFFVCILKEHENTFKIKENIKQFIDIPINYVIIDVLQDGPAKSCYLSKPYINDEDPLIIVNCDQIIFDLNLKNFLNFANRNDADGVVGTFFSNSPKNSYIKLNDSGFVVQIKEKEILSNYATNGLHYWKKSKYFFDSCDIMFSKNDKTLNEFYVAPSYNYMINEGMKVLQYFFNEHFPIGIPEDLERFKKLKFHENIQL